jgi:D-glycero-D-manno-heptose 1,7-bisphosphate phosphatase
MKNDLESKGVVIHSFYICLHTPEVGCSCRKPKIEMALKAEKEHNLNLSQCFVIGDKKCDIDFGKNIGCKAIQVYSEKHSSIKESDYQALDLLDAAEWIAGT